MYKYEMEEYIEQIPKKMSLPLIFAYISMYFVLNIILFFSFKNILISTTSGILLILISIVSLKSLVKAENCKRFNFICAVINIYGFLILITIVVLWQLKIRTDSWIFILESFLLLFAIYFGKKSLVKQVKNFDSNEHRMDKKDLIIKVSVVSAALRLLMKMFNSTITNDINIIISLTIFALCWIACYLSTMFLTRYIYYILFFEKNKEYLK